MSAAASARVPAGLDGPFPVLQVALDFLDLDRALVLAREAVRGGVDWIEAGTPLVKAAGLEAVRRLRREFPRHVIVADLKTMDAGRVEVEAAARAGASVAVCLAAASDATLAQCVAAGREHGVRILCDTIGLADDAAARRAARAEALGVDYVGVHLPVDEQMQGKDAAARLAAVVAAVKVPVAVAGGVTSETAAGLAAAGASVVIVGGALHKAPDAAAAARDLRRALDERRAVRAAFGARGGEDGIRDTLMKASASNLSDALHHQPGLRGLAVRTPGKKAVGPAQTARTAPGDWSKVVQAIDRTPPGGVLVVDAGGVPPAVWGELATRSAIGRGLAGVVVHGAIRDTDVALALGLPLWSAAVCPDAGDAAGHGEIGGLLRISGREIRPGDWIVADDDGVMVLAREKAAEYANRALDVCEGENRLRAEILAGKTLAEVARLGDWEKRT